MLVYQRVSEVHSGISSATQYYTPGYDMIYEYMWCMMWIWRWIADDIQGKKHHDFFLPRTHDNHGEIMVKSPHFVTWPRCGGTPKTFVDQTAVPWRNCVPQKSGDICWTYIGHTVCHTHTYIYTYYVYVFIYIQYIHDYDVYVYVCI